MAFDHSELEEAVRKQLIPRLIPEIVMWQPQPEVAYFYIILKL